MSVNKQGEGARWRRTTGQEIYSPLLLAFTHEVQLVFALQCIGGKLIAYSN